MNAGRDTRPLSGYAIAALVVSAIMVLILAAAVAITFFSAQSEQISKKNELAAFNAETAVAIAKNNEPTGPNAAYIKEADANYPLSDKITVYDGDGERMALADVDPSEYTGFAAYVSDSFVESLGENAEGTQLADGVTYVCGNLVEAQSLEALEAGISSSNLIDKDDIMFVEPSYNIMIIDDDPQTFFNEQGDEIVAASGEVVSLGSLMAETPTQASLTNDKFIAEQTDLVLVGAEQAWSYTKGSQDVVVAVMDGGLMGTGTDEARDTTVAQVKHLDMDYDNTVVEGYNFVAKNTSTEDIGNKSVSGYGHGTFVAGQIAAMSNNGRGVSGLAPGVKIAPYKVFDVAAVGSTLKMGTTNEVYSALLKAVEQNIDVLNMSLGWQGNFNELCYLGTQMASVNGTILVASAGNEATNKTTYPAAYETVIGVSATTNDTGDFAAKWNVGGSNYGEANVVVSAPGTDSYGLSTASEASYTKKTGTSMAAPIVSSIAALAKSVDKTIDTARFHKLIKETATAKSFNSNSTTPGTTYDDRYGWGLINAGALVAAAYDEKAAGITYPTQGFAGEVFWTLDSKGELNLWPVTPNGRTFWVIHTTGYVYPWQNYASSVKSVNVEKGVNFASHGYYLFIPTSNGYQPYEYQYSPTLVNAFKGFSNCEKFNLSGMIASSISATGMFEGCTSAKQITFGSGWSSYATFPQVADGQTAFKGWKVNGNAAAGLYKPGDVIPVNTNAFSAVFEGDEGSENENQNPVVTPDPPQTTTPNDNQLSVAVPITLDLSFGNAGLSKVRHLNRGSYGVENTGESAVKITDVEMLDPADGFDVDAIYQRGDSGALNYQEQPIDKNTVMLVYDDGTNYTYIGYKHPLSAARHLADAAIHDRYSFTDKHEVTIQPNEKLLISFNNSLCFIPTNKPLSAAAGNKSTLCKIAYTISAA